MKLSGGMMVTLGFGVFLIVMASIGGGPISGAIGVLLIVYVLFTARTMLPPTLPFNARPMTRAPSAQADSAATTA